MGGISGFYGGKIDMVIQRVVDVLYGIPSLIVTILLMVVVGNGVHCLILAMCCVGWIGGCRFVRGEVLKLRESDFVSAAKILGVPDIVIIVKHILPNIMGLIITNLTMAIPGAIFQEAFLSYIGLGIKPPNCSWGVLAKDGIAQLRTSQCLMRLNPEPPGFFEGGEILYKGKDVLKMNKKELRQFRGKEISYIFQDPMTSLNPTMRIGKQIEEVFVGRKGMSAAVLRWRRAAP